MLPIFGIGLRGCVRRWQGRCLCFLFKFHRYVCWLSFSCFIHSLFVKVESSFWVHAVFWRTSRVSSRCFVWHDATMFPDHQAPESKNTISGYKSNQSASVKDLMLVLSSVTAKSCFFSHCSTMATFESSVRSV